MESPVLSRTASATFAPGSRRRSHSNLHHLSLAPLTPKYPIDPADYDAYFDPATSELHTSASISQIASLPSPGGILSHSVAHSRASSRPRLKRKVKSTVSIRAPADPAAGALTGEGLGHKKSSRNIYPDSSWLVQTGLAITEGSRESKGQSWIFKRDSSTSLHTLDDRPRSGLPTPNISRRSSRRRSRRDLTMIAAGTHTEHDGPDWADSHTQAEAEAAAEVENEIVDDFDDDPYGMLDFEGHFDRFDSEDEEDVRNEISKYGLGHWLDGIVDSFLQLEEFTDPQVQELDPNTKDTKDASEVPSQKDPETASVTSERSVEPPPDRPRGLWDDLAWFGRLVARTVRS